MESLKQFYSVEAVTMYKHSEQEKRDRRRRAERSCPIATIKGTE